MSTSTHPSAQSGASKTARNPVKVVPVEGPLPRKPPWLRVRAPVGPEVTALKGLLRQQRLVNVCEEASCPNLGECFAHGTATFMVMGELCTRRCPFCDVAHGCTMLTVGQYLQPSRGHLPVERFVEPARFEELRRVGEEIGFANVASGPLVRSSYHADRQAAEVA